MCPPCRLWQEALSIQARAKAAKERRRRHLEEQARLRRLYAGFAR